MNEAAVTLRALGLLTKAVKPIQASLEIILAQRDRKNAADAVGNLCGLKLTQELGDVGRRAVRGTAGLDGNLFPP